MPVSQCTQLKLGKRVEEHMPARTSRLVFFGLLMCKFRTIDMNNVIEFAVLDYADKR